MNTRITVVTMALAATTLSSLALAQLDMEMFGQRRPPPFFHPKGYYAVEFPGGWEHKLTAQGQLVANKLAGDRAELTITMKSVPNKVDTEMVAHNAGIALRKLPTFVDRGGGTLTVAGKPASVRSFEFDYQGNTEYTVAVEELYIVSGSVLYTVHFEVLKRSFRNFQKDLQKIYGSIIVAEIDADGQPMHPVRPRAKASPDSIMVPGPGR
ncbi:MAG: hypothetical protein ABIJ09_25930 [Pseudomonadota bacterium]